MINVIESYFEYIDNIFFNSNYRKKYCTSKIISQKTILNLFGKIAFKRRYYYNKKDNNKDIRNMYFNNFRSKKITMNHSSAYYKEYNDQYNKINFNKPFHFDNYINFI